MKKIMVVIFGLLIAIGYLAFAASSQESVPQRQKKRTPLQRLEFLENRTEYLGKRVSTLEHEVQTLKQMVFPTSNIQNKQDEISASNNKTDDEFEGQIAKRFALPLKVGQVAFLGSNQVILVEEMNGGIWGQLIIEPEPQHKAELVYILGVLPNDIIKVPSPSKSLFLHIKIKKPLKIIGKKNLPTPLGDTLVEFTLMPYLRD